MTGPANPEKIIYLVDDDEDDRITFVDAIQKIDVSFDFALFEDGKQLMDNLYSISENLPEIIFLDINMPVKNGFECLEEIRRQDSPFNRLNIVMLSTSKSQADITKARTLGASFYAAKPNTFKEWKSMISEILKMEFSEPSMNNNTLQLC